MKQSVLILGATSSIARSLAIELAKSGESLYLASQDVLELERVAQDLRVKFGIHVKIGAFQAQNLESHVPFFEKVLKEINGLKGVIMAFGTKGDHDKASRDAQSLRYIFDVNLIGACSILSIISDYFEEKKQGWIIGIGSVGGNQTRWKNYFYGAAKGGLSLFLQGLRCRLHSSNVHVMTVKPGYVDTAMTFGKKSFMMIEPEGVAKTVMRALDKKKEVVYIPKFWRYISAASCSLPEWLYKRVASR